MVSNTEGLIFSLMFTHPATWRSFGLPFLAKGEVSASDAAGLDALRTEP